MTGVCNNEYRLWSDAAEEFGEEIANELLDAITKKVQAWKEKNAFCDENGTLIFDCDKIYVVNDLYNELYQEEDVSNFAWEYSDGRFIYSSIDELVDALRCINELEKFACNDTGLWQGKTDYFDIINIKATDALQGAVLHYAEETIKAEILAQLIQD